MSQVKICVLVRSGAPARVNSSIVFTAPDLGDHAPVLYLGYALSSNRGGGQEKYFVSLRLAYVITLLGFHGCM